MTKKIFIEGMKCGNCVKHVKEALSELNEVTSVDVNLEAKTIVLVGAVTDEDIKAAIDEAGYEVVGIEVL